MAYAITAQNYYSSYQNVFATIKDCLNSQIRMTDVVLTKNFLSHLKVPEEYPAVEEIAKAYANTICSSIYKDSKIEPNRIEASVEGGIAIVYNTKKGFLKKMNKEVFIEVYNDSEIAISYSENYKAKLVEEVSLDCKKIFDDYISKLL